MKILVTGGAGFIGSTVVDEFISLGHQVWVVDNESSGNKKNINAKARYQKCDVRDAAGLRKIFKKVRFDVVDHHAAQIDVRKSVADPVYDANVNIIGLLNVLELCKEFKTKNNLYTKMRNKIKLFRKES